MWQTQFAGDQSIIGKSVTLDGKQLPSRRGDAERFRFPARSRQYPSRSLDHGRDFARKQRWIAADDGEQRGNNFLGCIARLKRGVSMAQAQANMDTISASLAQQYPDSDAYFRVLCPVITRCDRWSNAFRVDDAERDGGMRGPRRLRQRRQSSPRAFRFAAKTNQHSRRARRRSPAHRAAIARRKRFAQRHWWPRRFVARHLGDSTR